MRHSDLDSNPIFYLFGFLDDCDCSLCEDIEDMFRMVSLETAKTMED